MRNLRHATALTLGLSLRAPAVTSAGVGSSGQQDSRGGDKYDETSAVVAIKQFKGLADMEDEHTKNYVRLTQQREADLALSLLHPNIVRCLGTLTNGEAFGPSRKTTALAEGESGEDGEKGSDAVLAGGGGDDVKGGGSGGSCPSGRSASEVAFLVFEHVPATLLDLIQDRPGGLSLPTVSAQSRCARISLLGSSYMYPSIINSCPIAEFKAMNGR